MELSSLKGSMDEQLEAINVDNAINKLITQLVLNPKAWIAVILIRLAVLSLDL